MRRTLLTAGVFALLAMIYVPTPHRGYRLIFSSDDTSLAFFQLLVNVVFAALLGAILATIIPKLPWWAWRWITGIAVIALLCIGGVAWRNFTAAAADRARFDEEFADSQLAYHYPDAAKFTLRSAARNWRLALRFDEATRVENRIKDIRLPTWDETTFDPSTAVPVDSKPWEDYAAQGQPVPTPKKYISTDPNAGEPIPRARPVRSPSSQLTFDDLIPARTATPRKSSTAVPANRPP
jgi:hypothetical protein